VIWDPGTMEASFLYHRSMCALTLDSPKRAPFRTHDKRLEPIAVKVISAERLSFDDGLVLYGS